MWAIFLLTCLALAGSVLGQITPAFYQLEKFKNSTNGPIGEMTTTYGAPVPAKEADNSLDMELLDNVRLLEEILQFNHERVPQRPVHAKGAGALGYFEVTHDITNISNAALFSRIGKITPVATRFSASTSDRGTPDTIRSSYGFAVKFYTEEGNWDFTGFNTDIFFVKDPLFFPAGLHALFRNPKNNLPDFNAQLDYFFSRPESIAFLTLLLGDNGTPGSFRNIQGNIIHTLQVENDRQEISFVRFKFTPDLGETFLNTTQAATLAGSSPEYYTADLYNAIECGQYPTWTLNMQVIPEADVKKAGFDIFDVTVRWPLDKYKLLPVGKMTLNKNPDNYFRVIEQLAFNPGNVVPGIQGCDRMFKSRVLAYRDSAIYRLGVNFNKIEINCPLNSVYHYYRDGHAPVRDNFGETPNYYPNSFNGPAPVNRTRTRTKKYQPVTVPEATNFAQIAEQYNSLAADAKERLLTNLVGALAMSYPFLQSTGVEYYTQIDAALGAAVQAGLVAAAASANTTSSCAAAS